MRTTRFGSTDLLFSLAVVLMLGTFGVCADEFLDEEAARRKCMSHLQQIGQAVLLYSNENRGAYPRTVYDLRNPQPVWGTPYANDRSFGAAPDADPFAPEGNPNARLRPERNDVSAALFLLMRTQDITPDVFVCPSTFRLPWDFGGPKNTARNWTNWQGIEGLREHLGYSYQNPYPSEQAIAAGFKLNNATSAEFAVAADMNPGTDELLKLSHDSPLLAMRDGNSLNHAREGQNVLYGDGAVRFVQTPFAGQRLQNIYTYGPSGREDKGEGAGNGGIAGPPAGPSDSVLLPTAKALGLLEAAATQPAAPPKPLTAQQKQALTQQLVGRYARNNAAGQVIELEVTSERLIATAGPMSIAYSYQIKGKVGDRIRLDLSARNTKPSLVNIVIEQGGLVISGEPAYEGRWKREAAGPAPAAR